ncbi:hypothetical protein OHA_1_00842 [Pleomorphomonas sp. SM30]|uniref:Flp pilus assembly protein TadG n=2 Tax=Oharaeibacter diazotrophicus TaxID=1920512 RepID=A0A4R6RM04_9HYPH|nr:hypothetical protein EDD54_0669 [Oharaeibacter diazotrophicus]BBE71271.1 hypothetical protein OHA_1_00842 [Pleomorphomonas sp. SM30]
MRSFRGDHRASISMIAALCLLPLALTVGMSIDYIRQAETRDAIQEIADKGAVLAVSDEHNTKTAAELKASAESYLKSTASTNLSIGVDFEVEVAIDLATSQRRSSVSYKAELSTTFMGVVGISKLGIGGAASAVSGLPPDTNFYFLLDTSDSMGLAATDAARGSLIALSQANGSGSCEFACHVVRGGSKSLLAIARANNLKLRIDVAKEGITKIVSLAQAAAARDGVVNRFALTSMASQLKTVSDLTSDASAFSSQLSGVDLGYGTSGLANTLWESSVPNYLTELARLTAASNDPNADRIVVLVTDGLRSQDGGSGKDSNGRPLIRAFDLDQCQAIKDAGYKLAVIYTMYYDIPYNGWYNTYVKPIRANLGPNLASCATPGLYAVGDTPEQIDAAFETIFKAMRSFPRVSS